MEGLFDGSGVFGDARLECDGCVAWVVIQIAGRPQ